MTAYSTYKLLSENHSKQYLQTNYYHRSHFKQYVQTIAREMIADYA